MSLQGHVTSQNRYYYLLILLNNIWIVQIFEFIQFKTLAQYKSCMWRNQRVGTLTSTTFDKIGHYKGSDREKNIVTEIMGLAGFKSDLSTKYDKETEPAHSKETLHHTNNSNLQGVDFYK